MVDPIYDWDPQKAASFIARHAVSFQSAIEALQDPDAFVEPDPYRHEDRWRTTGRRTVGLLFIVTTEPADDTIRIISAREATKHETAIYDRNARP